MTCSPFWLNDVGILVREATEFFPFTEHDQRCTASALNSFTRFGLYLGVVLAVVRFEPVWLLVGVAFAVFAVGAWIYMGSYGSVREGFNGVGATGQFATKAPILDPREVIDEYVPDVIGLPAIDRTYPTDQNPFMNVLITEISDDPKRPAAALINSDMNSYYQTIFAKDPGDVFQHTQNQRNWVTMPSTTIPNDQGTFANWLYRVPGQTCKEGNLSQCFFNTGAEGIPWRETRRLT
jgi:hypothetical protein